MVSSSSRNAKDHRQSLSSVLGNTKGQPQEVGSHYQFQGVKVEALSQELSGIGMRQTTGARKGANQETSQSCSGGSRVKVGFFLAQRLWKVHPDDLIEGVA